MDRASELANQIIEVYSKNNHFGRFMNMTFNINEPGLVEYSLNVKEELLATPTAAHGGAIAGFMDAIVGVAALSATASEGKVVSTVEFKINFLKPALLNEKLRGIGKVIQKGNRLLIVQGEIYNSRSELVATAIATMNAYPIEKSSF